MISVFFKLSFKRQNYLVLNINMVNNLFTSQQSSNRHIRIGLMVVVMMGRLGVLRGSVVVNLGIETVTRIKLYADKFE